MISVRRSVSVVLLDFLQLIHNDFLQHLFAGQYFLVLGNLLLKLVIFLLDFVALQGRQALQLQLEDGLGLPLREFEAGRSNPGALPAGVLEARISLMMASRC